MDAFIAWLTISTIIIIIFAYYRDKKAVTKYKDLETRRSLGLPEENVE